MAGLQHPATLAVAATPGGETGWAGRVAAQPGLDSDEKERNGHAIYSTRLWKAEMPRAWSAYFQGHGCILRVLLFRGEPNTKAPAGPALLTWLTCFLSSPPPSFRTPNCHCRNTASSSRVSGAGGSSEATPFAPTTTVPSSAISTVDEETVAAHMEVRTHARREREKGCHRLL